MHDNDEMKNYEIASLREHVDCLEGALEFLVGILHSSQPLMSGHLEGLRSGMRDAQEKRKTARRADYVQGRGPKAYLAKVRNPELQFSQYDLPQPAENKVAWNHNTVQLLSDYFHSPLAITNAPVTKDMIKAAPAISDNWVQQLDLLESGVYRSVARNTYDDDKIAFLLKVRRPSEDNENLTLSHVALLCVGQQEYRSRGTALSFSVDTAVYVPIEEHWIPYGINEYLVSDLVDAEIKKILTSMDLPLYDHGVDPMELRKQITKIAFDNVDALGRVQTVATRVGYRPDDAGEHVSPYVRWTRYELADAPDVVWFYLREGDAQVGIEISFDRQTGENLTQQPITLETFDSRHGYSNTQRFEWNKLSFYAQHRLAEKLLWMAQLSLTDQVEAIAEGAA